MLAATLPHPATKAELANTRADVQTLRIELNSDIAAGLAEKPSKATCGASSQCYWPLSPAASLC